MRHGPALDAAVDERKGAARGLREQGVLAPVEQRGGGAHHRGALRLHRGGKRVGREGGQGGARAVAAHPLRAPPDALRLDCHCRGRRCHADHLCVGIISSLSNV